MNSNRNSLHSAQCYTYFCSSKSVQTLYTSETSCLLRNSLKNLRTNQTFTFSTTEPELGSWQSPWLKDPQAPDGFPKLANLIAEMRVLLGQCNCAVAFLSWVSSVAVVQDSTEIVGWSSDTILQNPAAFLLENLIWVGSPPLSSKITNTFPDGLNQDRGTWYLRHKIDLKMIDYLVELQRTILRLCV